MPRQPQGSRGVAEHVSGTPCVAAEPLDRSVDAVALVRGLGDVHAVAMDAPVSLTAYRSKRRDVVAGSPWTRILSELPREERLMYAGMAGDEGHLIDILAFDPDPAVRRCVALHPGLTARGQWELVRDPDATIRERLGRNVCAEPEILELLGRDLDLVVRKSVAANEAAPEEVRRRLARDAQPSVRAAVRQAREGALQA